MKVKDIEAKFEEGTKFAIFHWSDTKMENPLFVSEYGKYRDYKELQDSVVEGISNYEWASGSGIAIFI